MAGTRAVHSSITSMLEYLETLHGTIRLPAFLPDGTRGVVRSLDALDLAQTGTQGIVMNVYHLMQDPGASVIKRLGGLHQFCGWSGPILTDSGGFQVYSLLRENPQRGVVRPKGVIFHQEKDRTLSKSKKIILSPEKCIQLQFQMGSDIIMCLDWCTHPEDSPEITRESVDLTIRWAKACRKEYDRQLENRGKEKDPNASGRPLLFGIIQGGGDFSERKRCASALLELEFDGYGFGGWPLDSQGNLLKEILEYTANLMPKHLPKYALGVGKPENVVACVKMGYTLFDTVLPTRDARHKRLYVFNASRWEEIDLEGDFYSYLYLQDERYRTSGEPISLLCDCLLCRNYSRAYLYHLFTIGDTLAFRLATLHNLRFYNLLFELIRQKYGPRKDR